MLNYLKRYLAVQGKCRLMIQGTSMSPVICEGETVEIQRYDTYSIGDILVFYYKNEGLLAHRCLKIKEGRYFCKGDNSLRLEDITTEQIVGKIDLPNDPHRTEEFLNASYGISYLFRKCRYNREIIMQTEEYQEYKRKYLEQSYDKI